MKVIAVIAGLMLAACPVPQHLQGQLDQDLRVRHGHQVGIVSDHLILEFTTLNAEARCPKSVTCIRAGEATITIRIGKEHLATETRTLTIPGINGSDQVRYLNYSITLKALDPYPATPGKPVPETYEATLVVSKSP